MTRAWAILSALLLTCSQAQVTGSTTTGTINDPPQALATPWRLPTAAPSPGGLKGAPDSGTFRFTHKLGETCRREVPPVTNFPLKLPDGLASKQLFLTQSSEEVRTNGTIWKEAWDQVAQYLPRIEADIWRSKNLRSCAVVGNSGTLNLGKYGAFINAHGTVFRINKAPTMYFAHKVGDKTDFRLLNRKLSHWYSREHFVPNDDLPMERGVTLAMSRIAPDQLVLYLTRMARGKVKQDRQDVKVTMVNNRFLGHAKVVFDSFAKCLELNTGTGGEGGGVPTSGLLLTLVAIHLCQHVTVYGIGDSSTKRAPYQYFQMRMSGNGVHSFGTERELMQALAKERLIRLCGGDGCVGKAMPVGIQRSGAAMPKGHLVNKMLEQHTRGKRLRPIQKQVANIFGSRALPARLRLRERG